eukprot:SAG11_NODE_15906_length_563_cov_0.790948_1_plen_22_part_10
MSPPEKLAEAAARREQVSWSQP